MNLLKTATLPPIAHHDSLNWTNNGNYQPHLYSTDICLYTEYAFFWNDKCCILNDFYFFLVQTSFLTLCLGKLKILALLSIWLKCKYIFVSNANKLQLSGGESDTTERLQLSLFTFMHWRRQWQPTPVFLPGESQGRGSLVGCLWGRTESDTTEVT